MNVRANIMYFIEHFVPLARKEGHGNYIKMIQRDIIRIVDAVAPDDGTGAANIKVVRKVLSSWATLASLKSISNFSFKVLRGLNQGGFILNEILKDIEAALDDREIKDFVFTSPAKEQDDQKTFTAKEASGARRLDTRQIEQRIEEDRERHKRQRETMWAVPYNGPDDITEQTKSWDETSDYGSDDDRLGSEETVGLRQQEEFECGHAAGRDVEMKNA
jgi:CTD kinase subunit gamma